MVISSSTAILFVPGQKKQDLWISNIDDLLANRSTDKRFTPIFIEMKKYENVPRKKKPFMNWSKCTMKRFPYRVVEEAFDLLVSIESGDGDENTIVVRFQYGWASKRHSDSAPVHI